MVLNRTRTAIVAAFVLVLAPWHANAQPPPASSASPTDRADELMKEGVALGDQKRWSEARKKLEEAWALKKSYDIAANLALVEIELGEFAAAATHFDYAIRTVPVNAKPEHKERLLKQFEGVRGKVGSLRIQLAAEGATIRVDGVEVARSPLANELFVEPGAHIVQVTKDGYKMVSRPVTAEAGKSLSFTIDLQKTDDTVVVPPPAEEKPIWPYFLLGGLGAVGAGLGVGLHIASASRAEDATGAICPGDRDTCPAGAADAASSANAMLGGAIAGYTLAGLSIVGLIAYGAWSGPPPAESAVRVVPALGPQGAGIQLTGTF